MNDKTYICTLVGTFGLTESENQIVDSLLPDGTELMVTDNATDLIAGNTFFNILRPYALSTQDLDFLMGFYEEVGIEGTPIQVIADGAPFDTGDVHRVMKVWPSFDAMLHRLELLLLTYWSHNKRSENFSASLSSSIQILSTIRRKPGVTTKELAEKLEVSTRTVQRYIESLRVAGEWIEYDQSIRGWKLTAGKSVLWGDFDE